MTVSSVNFGNVSVQDGKVTLSPVIKGIDFKKIVDSLVDVKNVEIIKQKNALEKSFAYTQALTTVQQNLQGIKTAAQPLRNSLDPYMPNVFNAMVISLQSTNPSVNPNSVLSVMSSVGVQPGNYSLTINALATADIITASAGVSDPTVAQTGVTGGNLTINGIPIAVASQVSLNQLVTAINALKNQTNVSASVVKVSSTEYYLALNATTTGVPITISDDQSGALLSELNIAPSGATTNSLSAQLTYNNLSITRPTNQINDLLPFLTLNLNSAAVGNPITVIIEPDTAAINTAVQNFVTAYNTYQSFYLQQTLTDPMNGKVDPNAILFNENLLRLTSSYLSNTINSMALGVPYAQPNTLEALGITLTQQGNLILNQETLNTFLMSNPSGVEQICGFSTTSNNDQIIILDIPPFLNVSFVDQTTYSSYPVTVTYQISSEGVASATLSMNGSVENAIINNGCISPQEGSIFTGFGFFCDPSTLSDGDSVSTIFTFSQGMMDTIANTIEGYLAPSGAFDTVLTHLSQEQRFIYKKMNETEIKINEERERLTKMYAKVAEAYEKMEINIQTIRDFNDSFYSRN